METMTCEKCGATMDSRAAQRFAGHFICLDCEHGNADSDLAEFFDDAETLAQFRARMNRHSIESACDLIGMESKDFADSMVTHVLVHESALLYVFQWSDGRFSVPIERSESVGTFESVTAFLYFDWYVFECVDRDAWTLDTLTDLLAAFATWARRDLESADEMRARISKPATFRDQLDSEWLDWFCNTWEHIQERDSV